LRVVHAPSLASQSGSDHLARKPEGRSGLLDDDQRITNCGRTDSRFYRPLSQRFGDFSAM